MPPYRAVLADEVKAFLRGLTAKDLRIADEKIMHLRQDPFAPPSKKYRKRKGCRIRRSGDYRMVYAVSTKNKVIDIFEMDNRKTVYGGH